MSFYRRIANVFTKSAPTLGTEFRCSLQEIGPGIEPSIWLSCT